MENVSATEGLLTLPTYALRGENPNPVFHSQYGVAHIYPYSLLDDIAPKPAPRAYRTLVLENRYLRLTVLPELGGRVYSLYDKISQREVFYRNPVVKFAPLAIRGAFFSGGLEFSFPVAHAPTTADAVNWDMRQHPDGSATISCGGLEHMGRLRWTISLTLFPELCALAQDVQLQNPGALPGRYHYWTNASLAADEQTEFVYPLRRVRSYEYSGSAPWPTSRIDLLLDDPGLEGMEGVPRWPASRLHQPVDFRWQKNMLAQVSIFGREVSWDYFGAWQHGLDAGYAHVADHHDVSGMKLWSWGNAGTGVMNQAALTDDGSLYAETQCGAMETQLDFAFLSPGAVRRWREWWLPLRGMGGLTCAAAELGARLSLHPSAQPGSYTVTLALCPSGRLPSAELRLSIPQKILFQSLLSLSPEEPWSRQFDITGAELGTAPLTMQVTAGGRTLLSQTWDRSASPVEPYSSVQSVEPQTARDYYHLGLKHENFDNRLEAKKAYQKAVHLQPGHGPAHLRLGLLNFRAADFAAAEVHLQQALLAGEIEAAYYLGLLKLYLDDVSAAEAFFTRAGNDHAPSLGGLGRIALGKGAWRQALSYFEQAGRAEPDSLIFPVLRALALARAGDADASGRDFLAVLERDSLSHPALAELARLPLPEAETARRKLERLLADDPQYYLDLACFYMDVRLFSEAAAVLDIASRVAPNPMLSYMRRDVARRLGEEALPEEDLIEAGARPLASPSRLEEVIALQRRLERFPQDACARFFLGNFYYAHERFAEAVALWEEAAKQLSAHDVLFRNLGLAAWQQNGDLPGATSLLENALRLNPANQDLYLLLDTLYKEQGLINKRTHLLARMQAIGSPRDDIHKRQVQILVDLGRHEEALAMLEHDSFVASEMDQSFRNAYTRAYIMRAEDHLTAGNLADAIAALQQALQYPANVGVGAPVSGLNAEIYYRLGCALEQAGRFAEALAAWQSAAGEYHPHGTELYPYVSQALDKLNRYSELGLAAGSQQAAETS